MPASLRPGLDRGISSPPDLPRTTTHERHRRYSAVFTPANHHRPPQRVTFSTGIVIQKDIEAWIRGLPAIYPETDVIDCRTSKYHESGCSDS